MGAVLSLFQGGEKGEKIVIDFENVTPTQEEQEVWDSVRVVLEGSSNILTAIAEYKGCEDLIRKAIAQVSPENEEECWKALLPRVDVLHDFYEFSIDLKTRFIDIIRVLSKAEAKLSLVNYQALSKQLGLVLDFVLQFDNKKLGNSSIQNDFSYYRRTLNRMKGVKKDCDIKIRDETANKMSMFFAYSSPMMQVLTEAVNTFTNEVSDEIKDNISGLLCTLANVCNDMVTSGTFTKTETNLFCLRVMTGSIILNDTISNAGSFHKKSPIRIKECIMQLKNYNPDDAVISDTTKSLLDTLRFTSKHIQDPETPGYIKALLI
ncbi:CYRIA/CYRIB Rac1 binding domain-containing protein [Entamoeba marina]